MKKLIIVTLLLASCASISPRPFDPIYHRSANFKHSDHKSIECKVCHNLEYRADSERGIKLNCVNCHK